MGDAETPRNGGGRARSLVSDVKERRRRAPSHIEQGFVRGAAIGLYWESRFDGHQQRELGALSHEGR